MKRKDLVEKLECLSPALANNDLIPVYQNFVFNGKTITAYRDDLAITCGCDDLGKFAVNGKLFLGLLQNSGAEDISVKLVDEDLHVKAAKSTFKLPFMDEGSFLFEAPKGKWAVEIAITEKMLKAIKLCLMTAAREENMKKIMGVCVHTENQAFYGCDGDAITSVGVEMKGKGEYLLSIEFCTQLLRLMGVADVAMLRINDEWSMAEMSNGYDLYGRVVLSGDVFDYEGNIQNTLNEEPSYVKVPKELDEALARACVITNIESAPTQIRVAKGKLHLVTSTHFGNVDDTVDLKGHGDVEATVHASLMHRSISTFEQMAILENCTVYKGEDAIQVVSNVSE